MKLEEVFEFIQKRKDYTVEYNCDCSVVYGVSNNCELITFKANNKIFSIKNHGKGNSIKIDLGYLTELELGIFLERVKTVKKESELNERV